MQGEKKAIILAIDDDPVILNTVVFALKNEYSVRPFTSGESALQFLAKHPADLILLDYQMPGMSGLKVLAELQSSTATEDIPVIFITGSSSGDSEVEVLEKGAVDYIQKPVRTGALLTRVRLQLELQRHRKHLESMVLKKTQSLNIALMKLQQREDVTLNMLARATDLRDHDTGIHIERTTAFVRIITEDLLENPEPGYELSQHEAEDIIRSAKLHDLGKIAMPDNVLLKPGRLTDEEFEIIKTHTERGRQLLVEFVQQEDDAFLNMARDIAYSHHEKWNGGGYPQGLSGNDIPLPARIVAIADVYDAITSARPYKEAQSHENAVQIILKDSGQHFDPYLTTVFERHAKDFEQVTARQALEREDTDENGKG